MTAPKLPPDDAIDPKLYAELCALPPHQVGEIIAGRLVVSPRPAVPHALASSVLGSTLLQAFHLGRGGPGGWWILNEPELHLGADAMVPEWAGWRRERVPALPDAAAITLAPDWVYEVVSPETAGLDRVWKLPRYAAAGVGHVWLADPRSQLLEVYRREGKFWLLVGTFQGDAVFRAEPFEAAELHLGDLWMAAKGEA